MKVSLILVNALALCTVSAYNFPSPAQVVKSALNLKSKFLDSAKDSTSLPNHTTLFNVNANPHAKEDNNSVNDASKPPVQAKVLPPKTKEEFSSRYFASKAEDIVLYVAAIKNPEFAKVVLEDIKNQVKHALVGLLENIVSENSDFKESKNE